MKVWIDKQGGIYLATVTDPSKEGYIPYPTLEPVRKPVREPVREPVLAPSPA